MHYLLRALTETLRRANARGVQRTDTSTMTGGSLTRGPRRDAFERTTPGLKNRREDNSRRRTNRQLTVRGGRLLEGGDAASCQTSHDPKLSSGNLRVYWPSHLLVVELAVAEASVQNADQAIGERAERLRVGLAIGPLAVVEAARTG